MGGFTSAQCLILLIVTASVLAVCTANKDWQWSYNNSWPYRGGSNHPKHTQAPKKIIVGGSEGWHFNFSYADWALKNGPFYLNDTLVFKYAPPTDNTTIPHSIYLLPSLRSYSTCNLTGAQMLANETQGDGEGFEFVLTKWKPHYFACGMHDGAHCKFGQMKFFVLPMLHSYW